MPDEELVQDTRSLPETLYTRSDWDRAVAEGTLTPDQVLDRLLRTAVHHFGDGGPASFDEDGFFLSLVADGLQVQGGVTLRVHTLDHPPPHVHVQRRGEEDIRINLETGELLDRPPAGVKSRQLRGFQAQVNKNFDTLGAWWEKSHGRPVLRRSTP